MITLFRSYLLPLIILSFLVTGCRKEAFEEYYGRPDWLASPIYQQLDSMGDFTSFLHCVELSGYKDVLGSAGSWTVFAPTDNAFVTYMQENGISNLSQIDKVLAEKIVRSAMVYDGERLEKLNDNFALRAWIEGIAFRRRTVYYDFVETETDGNGVVRKIVSTNRGAGASYVSTEYNNKHLTYFFKQYMEPRGLGAQDYKAFYPNSEYTGLNIANAKIDPNRSNIIAENGYIHVVDKVLMPEPNIEQYLRAKSDYSEFRNILDFFATYNYSAEVSRKHEVLTGSKDSVFVKGYQGIALALNNENYIKEDPNDAQTNNFSVTIPNNMAVRDYAKRVLLKYYPSGTTLKDLFYSNSTILVEYVNAHLYNTQVWPSRFTNERNISGEATRLSTGNIKEIKLLSNGAFYGVDASQHANVFRSVYSNVLLDPKYNFMQMALERVGLQHTLKIPTIRYLLILISDESLYDMGFSIDMYNTVDPIRYRGTNGTPEMRELLSQHIIPLGNDPLPNLAGSGILETFSGEYLKYNNNRITSSGRQDSVEISRYVHVDSISIGNDLSGPQNGFVAYVDGGLTSSDTNIGNYLRAIGAADASSPFNLFYNYLIASEIYSASDGVIRGVELGLQYTILMPNNQAITAAVAAGRLPANPASTDLLHRDMVRKFLQYHILRSSFAIDGKKTGTFETILRNIDGVTQSASVVTNQVNSLTVRDNTGATVSADVAKSNILGQRIVLHVLNGYLNHGI